jgi:hypothetical protein
MALSFASGKSFSKHGVCLKDFQCDWIFSCVLSKELFTDQPLD